MILVEIRCKAKGCGKPLKYIGGRPPSWDGDLPILICDRHTSGAIRGGARGFMPWARSQARAGKDGPPFMATLGQSVPWSQLRPAIEYAESHGETVRLFV